MFSDILCSTPRPRSHWYFYFTKSTFENVHWVWSLANVTAKASCTRSPWVRVNGMFNVLVWSFDFDLRDMSNEMWVSALLSLLLIEWRLCIDGVDWLFLFVSCFLIVFFPGFWLANRPEMATSDWSDFLAVDWLTMEHISILLPPDYILKNQNLLTLREAHDFTRCVTRSLVLCVCFGDRCLSFCTFFFTHCVVCSSSIYRFWLPLWYLQTLLSTKTLFNGFGDKHVGYQQVQIDCNVVQIIHSGGQQILNSENTKFLQ